MYYNFGDNSLYPLGRTHLRTSKPLGQHTTQRFPRYSTGNPQIREARRAREKIFAEVGGAISEAPQYNWTSVSFPPLVSTVAGGRTTGFPYVGSLA
jgi:hypothetical protein